MVKFRFGKLSILINIYTIDKCFFFEFNFLPVKAGCASGEIAFVERTFLALLKFNAMYPFLKVSSHDQAISPMVMHY
jgi:hypothetical protein